ncbi:unnamed protein product, partial [Heterosigma akashiwo]
QNKEEEEGDRPLAQRGWWRHEGAWAEQLPPPMAKRLATFIERSLEDPRYKTRMCQFWEQ